MKFYKVFPAFFVFSVFSICFLILSSCSLKYDDQMNAELTSPELKFTNVDYKKYENKKIDSKIKADVLERYRSDGSAYAKNAEFFAWNENQELITEGKCALLGIDTGNDIYTLFNNIFIHNIEQSFKIKATNLKWNGETKRLVSGKNDFVYLVRDDIEIEGSGFSASGITRSFSFENSVSGIVHTDEDKDENENKGMEENEIQEKENEKTE